MSIMSFENPLVTTLNAASARRKRRLATGSAALDTMLMQGVAPRQAAPTTGLSSAAARRVSTNGSAPAVNASGVLGKIIGLGMQQRGTPYSWGGGGTTGASRGIGRGANTVGFDCSGLVQYIYGKYGVKLPRNSAAQGTVGRAVSAGQARAGDLVVWNTAGHHHVGVYLGNGKYLNSPHTGDVVKVAPVNLRSATTIRRVV